MKKLIVVYDDTLVPNSYIRSIIGDKTVGEVILKRLSVKEKFLKQLQEFSPILFQLTGVHELEKLTTQLESLPNTNNYAVVHFFSYGVIRDTEQFRQTLSKAVYIEKNYVLEDSNHILGLFSADIKSYISLINFNYPQISSLSFFQNNNDWHTLKVNCFLNISHYETFLQYISGGFDARFFNSVRGDQFTVIKSSENIEKIKAEYEFYRLLPDQMKRWFVMPYHLCETEHSASYTMERYHMTDLALRWIHSAISQDEFRNILTKTFQFLKERESKPVSATQLLKIEKALYVDKVRDRYLQLQSHKDYDKLADLIKSGTEYSDLDEIIERYETIYRKIEVEKPNVLVIGHGDLCFSNMLFHKETELLKLIDPKGATNHEDLYTDSYYDLAKLSHSICGNYDFFNGGLFQITLQDNLKYHLQLEVDIQEYQKIFREFLLESGFQYEIVRVYEVSLFLSMLPLHMDKPLKVFGFILNAIKIMNEVEK